MVLLQLKHWLEQVLVKLILIDKDVVDITNVNRQIHATLKTVGRIKVEVMAERIAEINPDCKVDSNAYVLY